LTAQQTPLNTYFTAFKGSA